MSWFASAGIKCTILPHAVQMDVLQNATLCLGLSCLSEEYICDMAKRGALHSAQGLPCPLKGFLHIYRLVALRVFLPPC